MASGNIIQITQAQYSSLIKNTQLIKNTWGETGVFPHVSLV